VENPEQALHEAVHDLNLAGIDLLVSVGMIAAVMDRFPEEVMHNFREKVQAMTVTVREMTEETQWFGQAYDEGIDND
jgi:hypothetical protein